MTTIMEWGYNMIKMLIGNEEVVSKSEFTIDEQILSTSSTILNNTYPLEWENDKNYVSRYYYPKDYSKFKLLKDDNLIFCGLIKNSGKISLNPRYPHFCSLQILDFKALLSEGETLDFVINEKTVEEAIEMVIDAVKDYGFVKGNIKIFGATDIINAYSTLNKTAYDVFQYLADVTGSKWFTRLVDENTLAIDFYDPTLMDRGTDIDFTTEFFENNKIKDITFNYGSRDYRNKQIMISDQVYGSIDYTEIILANGYNTIFNTQSNIALLKSISVNNVEKTFGTSEDKEIGLEYDFYYTKGTNQIETDGTVYSSNTQITIVYTPFVQGREIVYNTDEVTRVASQMNRKGVISRYENRNDVVNALELNKIGQSYIKYKGSAEVILKLENEDISLYDVGQIVYFNAPLNDLKQDYMVKSKKTKIITSGSLYKVFYTYELTSSFNSEKAINFFDNQRNKATGNIQAGQSIIRNIDIENSANIIFKNLTISEIDVKGNNALNSILNSPFTE